jgi:adenosine kinase
MEILITGSVAYDYLMTFPGDFKEHILADHLDSISLSFLVESLIRRKGGVAPNIAYSLALLGGTPKIFATVGKDFDDYRRWLDENGVDTSLAKVIEDKYTASFFATTDQENHQIASFYPGAMEDAASLSIADLERKPDLVVISPNAPDAMDKYIDECIELGIPYLYDPSQQLVRMDSDGIKKGVNGANYLFINEYEFSLIMDKTGYSEDELINRVYLVAVTRGKDGSTICVDGQRHEVDVVPPKNISDPTGAGDAFRGGFLTGMSNGMDWVTCAQMGALTATYCLESDGPQGQSYTIEEYLKRYRENFDDQGLLDRLIEKQN